jgi:stage II sporulation protein AA (anti-sigma F factor antagonist)
MTGPLATVRATADGTVTTITVAGEIDLANADQVERQIADCISNQATAATLDLTDVQYVDSVGIRMLFKLTMRLRTAQIEFHLVAPIGSPARRVLEVSGLTSLVDVDPT